MNNQQSQWDGHPQININEYIRSMRIAFGNPAVRAQAHILTGAPGIAKSTLQATLLRQIISEMRGIDEERIGVLVEEVQQRDPMDFGGGALPEKREDGLTLVYTIPPLEMRIRDFRENGTADEPAPEGGYDFVIIILDEMLQTEKTAQRILSGPLHPENPTLGGRKLPDWMYFCGNGNRLADKAAANRLLAQVQDRVKFWELLRDFESFTKWWIEQGHNPLVLECAKANIKDEFFADAVPANDSSYCTFRSLTQASYDFDSYLKHEQFTGEIPGWMEKMFAANIGKRSAHMLAQFIRCEGNLPTEQEIMNGPEAALIPDLPGFQLMAGHLAIAGAKDEKTGRAALTYLMRLRRDLHVSLVGKLLHMSVQHGWALEGIDIVQWQLDHYELLPLIEAAGWE